MHDHLLEELGACIVAATALAYLARLLGQPLLLACIVAGIAIGPIGLRVITRPDTIQTLAELGLAFLLFIVGLEIDLKKLADSGKVASIATVVQVAGSTALGWGVGRLLGFGGLPALYLGFAMAFSSTMIVVKLLDARSELDTLPGHVTLSVLYDAGADYVLVPRFLAAERLREVVLKAAAGELEALRAAERAALEGREEVVA